MLSPLIFTPSLRRSLSSDARKYAMKILQFTRAKVYERISRRYEAGWTFGEWTE